LTVFQQRNVMVAQLIREGVNSHTGAGSRMGGGGMSPKITDQPRWHRNGRHPKLVSCHWFWLGVRATATPATHGSQHRQSAGLDRFGQ
jgi:hypothetical protein